MGRIYSEGWVGGITGNSTLVVLVSGHHDVARHPPVGAPAVCVCVGGGEGGEGGGGGGRVMTVF